MSSPISALKTGVKRALGRAGLEVTRSINSRGTVEDFIPMEATLRAARAAGLPVGDYIDEVMSKTPGATQATIDGMRSLGVFATNPATLLEVGPGSGRYLEKVLKECSPTRCEIYETSAPWADYLVENFGVIAQPTTGCSLAATPDSSVDLVMAHKVFNTVTFLCSSRYFFEMARVAAPGCYIVFDVMTETCLEPGMVRRWAVEGGEGHESWPSPMPRQTCVDLFRTLGCVIEGSFVVPMNVGSTEVLVFRKSG
jgi:hypothetical protein